MAWERLITFPMSLSLYDLTDPPRPHSILGRESELVPGATLEVLKAVRTLTGADGKAAPLLTVVLRVLQDVTCTGQRSRVKSQRK